MVAERGVIAVNRTIRKEEQIILQKESDIAHEIYRKLL